MASVTVPVPRDVDPTAVAVASRRPGEPWFCLEQPDRDRAALAALGAATALDAHGPDRFATVARRWRALAAGAISDAPDGPRGSGPIAVGRLRLRRRRRRGAALGGLPGRVAARAQVALARRGGDVRLTLTASRRPTTTPRSCWPASRRA